MADVFEVKIISPEQLFYEGTGNFVEFTTVATRILHMTVFIHSTLAKMRESVTSKSTMVTVTVTARR